MPICTFCNGAGQTEKQKLASKLQGVKFVCQHCRGTGRELPVVIESKASEPEGSASTSEERMREGRRLLALIYESCSIDELSTWEQEFLENVSDQLTMRGFVTPKQLWKLRDIKGKVI